MTEWQKAQQGFLYDANYDQELINARIKCADLCHELNHCKPSDAQKRNELLHQIFGKIAGDIVITSPFYCDYGSNITVGKNFYTNYNCVILDAAPVCFGDNVFIAPNCVCSTAGHPIDGEQRAQGLEIAKPIQVGNNVWIGANVSILPGVSIGNNVVIGAGSVVTKNIPDNVVAAGNPCHILRPITEQDKDKYPIWSGE